MWRNWARWESFNLEAGVVSVGLLLLMAVVPFLAVLELDQAGPALLRPCTWASWLTKSSAVHSFIHHATGLVEVCVEALSRRA